MRQHGGAPLTPWWNRGSRAQAAPLETESERIDLCRDLTEAFPRVFEAAWSATERTIEPLEGADLSALERRSPGLRGYDWRRYLRCSAARVVRALEVLSRVGTPGRALDLGAYFGNFALAAATQGWTVDALDSYRAYGAAFDAWRPTLQSAGVRRIDFDDVGIDLAGIPAATYDAVLIMGVIEHVPHSPRALLTAVRRVLKPHGLLILDTPNIAYGYNREKLARGESIMAPLASQFDSEVPFEGHHREYTMSEVRWMLERVGYDVMALDAFNYSQYGLERVSGDDLRMYREALADPTRREVIFAAARNPGA